MRQDAGESSNVKYKYRRQIVVTEILCGRRIWIFSSATWRG
jgi:hypothetical protein